LRLGASRSLRLASFTSTPRQCSVISRLLSQSFARRSSGRDEFEFEARALRIVAAIDSPSAEADGAIRGWLELHTRTHCSR
jgi:hypothetical protein